MCSVRRHVYRSTLSLYEVPIYCLHSMRTLNECAVDIGPEWSMSCTEKVNPVEMNYKTFFSTRLSKGEIFIRINREEIISLRMIDEKKNRLSRAAWIPFVP